MQLGGQNIVDGTDDGSVSKASEVGSLTVALYTPIQRLGDGRRYIDE
jgi:hypothetical protein